MISQNRQSPSGGSWAPLAQKLHSSRSCSRFIGPSRFTIRRRTLGGAEASKPAFDLAPDIGLALPRGGFLGGSFRHLLLSLRPPLTQQAGQRFGDLGQSDQGSGSTLGLLRRMGGEVRGRGFQLSQESIQNRPHRVRLRALIWAPFRDHDQTYPQQRVGRMLGVATALESQ